MASVVASLLPRPDRVPALGPSRASAWHAWFAIVLCACTFDFDHVGPRGGGGAGEGAGTDTAGGGSGGDGAGSEGGFAPCDRCIDLTGFSGPYSLPATCEEPTLRGGRAEVEPVYQAPAAVCNCACEPPAQLGCATPSLVFYDEAPCSGSATQPVAVPEGECIVTPVAAAYSFAVPNASGGATASCVSDGAESARPPVVFLDPVLGCDPNLAACGESATCFPAGSSGLCVVGDPELACPEGFEPAGLVLLEEELSDDRSCSCGCGALSAVCGPSFELYLDTACQMPVESAFTNQCQRTVTSSRFDGIVYRPTPINPSCTTTLSVDGAVAPGPERQICCM